MFLGDIENVSDTDLNNIKVLRDWATCESRDAYIKFLVHFGSCLFRRKEWNEKSCRQLFCSFVPPSLEAFGILVYKNNYEYWKHIHAMKQQGIDLTQESYTPGDQTQEGKENTSEVAPLYTTDSSCKKRVEGWNQRGIRMFNRIQYVLKNQRKSSFSTLMDDLILDTCVKLGKPQSSHVGRVFLADTDADEIQF